MTESRTSENQVSQCECNVPTLEVERSHVGNWYVQIIYCVECTTRLKTIVDHQAVIDGAAPRENNADFEEVKA